VGEANLGQRLSIKVPNRQRKGVASWKKQGRGKKRKSATEEKGKKVSTRKDGESWDLKGQTQRKENDGVADLGEGGANHGRGPKRHEGRRREEGNCVVYAAGRRVSPPGQRKKNGNEKREGGKKG